PTRVVLHQLVAHLYPRTADFCFARTNLHGSTLLITAPSGTGPFGMTNSRAPPAVRPPPTKPGFDLSTGDATPSAGLGNSITVKLRLCGIVSRSATCAGFIPAMSSAAVTKTSAEPGLPSIVGLTSPGTTRAIR